MRQKLKIKVTDQHRRKNKVIARGHYSYIIQVVIDIFQVRGGAPPGTFWLVFVVIFCWDCLEECVNNVVTNKKKNGGVVEK